MRVAALDEQPLDEEYVQEMLQSHQEPPVQHPDFLFSVFQVGVIVFHETREFLYRARLASLYVPFCFSSLRR